MIRALLTLLFLALAGVASAQAPATLVADSVTVTGGDRLIAEGNVEVFYDGTRLSAARVIYDRATDRLTIEGPILVVLADGTIFTATQAQLDPRLEGGLLLGARLVLNRQLQLAAGRIDRVEGRYSALTDVAVTSCQVCAGRAPLWEIRARQVIHDEEARQLYFDGAQFRIKGVPVLSLPRMRLPDPSLDRASGFLRPSIRSTDQLGIGLRLPYFIRMGDARDLTIAPYVSAETRTLELRYRQAFDNGALQISGAISNDTLREGETRGYLSATGAFALPRDLRLSFDLETVSDRAYLLDYGLTDTDVLESDITLFRVRDNDLLHGALTGFRSLREGEDNDLLPSLVGDLHYERRLFPRQLGGVLTYRAGFDSLYRVETGDGTGRDMVRIGGALDWRRSWVGPAGIVAEAEALAGLDLYSVSQDSAFDGLRTRTTLGTGLTLRWPFVGTASNGAMHLIEPVAQIAWSDSRGDDVPNEDSTLSEFDEGNLLALSRFAGDDLVETGLRGAAGLSWTRVGPGGWQSTLTFGRAFRETQDTGFSPTSGLRATRSDWLIAGQFDFGEGLSFGVRSLVDDSAEFTKTEARVDWQNARIALAAAYVFLPEDAAEGRDETVSEWTFDGSYRINDVWSVSGLARYDIVADSPSKAALGVDWRNECVEVGLSVSRRFTSSGNVEPSTDYDLTVELLGFSANGAVAGPSRACGG